MDLAWIMRSFCLKYRKVRQQTTQINKFSSYQNIKYLINY